MDACTALVEACDRIAAETASPRDFLVELGRQVAGVRRGPLWAWDAGRGGRNRLRGGGFRPHVDDGTDGQARHFAGIVAVAARLGPDATRWLSIHLGRDAPHSADGMLTDHAVDFARLIRAGALSPGAAGRWVEREICAVRP